MMVDGALEANRRLAWARYYHARQDLAFAALWAAELAEWLEALAPPDLPDSAAQLIEASRGAISDRDRQRIRGYVARQIGADRAGLARTP